MLTLQDIKDDSDNNSEEEEEAFQDTDWVDLTIRYSGKPQKKVNMALKSW